ncbi:hypothetical protein ACIQUM_24050 [Amycolatopsis azurea]|uniref:hypothetical protein n=1 Tax=Amycolatopsis azurea TaxID=36819 RepID=UPI0037FAA04F
MVGRSLEHRSFLVGGIASDEVVVASRFDHPRRGPVSCPAADLLAEQARDAGFRARIADITGARAENPPGGSPTLETASYLDHDDQVFGVGVASSGEGHASALARQLVERWSSVVRTRRALLAISDSGAEPSGSAGTRVRQFADRGDTVVVIGASKSATGTVTAYAPHASIPITAVGDLDSLGELDSEHISYLVAPGTPMEDAAEIVSALYGRFPRLRGPHPREFVYRASDRREALCSVAAASDVLLVCGPRDVPSGPELDSWAARTGCPAHNVSRLGDLKAEWLSGSATVGVAAACEAGARIADRITKALSGLGPLAVLRRRVITEHYRGADRGSSARPAQEQNGMLTVGR